MPIYEYKCNVCGAVKEKLQKTTDPKEPLVCDMSEFSPTSPCGGSMQYVPSTIGNFTIQASKIYL